MASARNRASRRAATRRIVRRRFALHREGLTGIWDDDPVAPGRFKKKAPWGCGCAKHRKGRPRVAKGMCSVGLRDRVYRRRAETRVLRAEVRGGAFDVDAGRYD